MQGFWIEILMIISGIFSCICLGFLLGTIGNGPSVPYLKYAYFIIIQALNVRICLTRLVLFQLFYMYYHKYAKIEAVGQAEKEWI